MAYATQADAEAIYGVDYVAVCCDRTGDGVADPAVVSAAFARADSVINGQLAGRIALPLATIPDDLKYVAVDVALYYASITCDVLTDQKENLFKMAMENLKSMALNMQSMGLEDPPTNLGGSAEVSSDARELNRSSLTKVL